MPYVQGLRWGFLCSNCWKRGELTEHEEPSKAECQLEFSLDLQGQRAQAVLPEQGCFRSPAAASCSGRSEGDCGSSRVAEAEL